MSNDVKNFKKIEDILIKHGWTIESTEPLEIYNKKTNSRASGYAAEIIIASLSQYRIDKCLVKQVLSFVNKEANNIHNSCKNDPCLGDACFTQLLLSRSKEILEKLEKLEQEQ